MLKSGSEKEKLFLDVSALVASIGLKTVEVSEMIQNGERKITAILYNPNKEIDTDELASAYRIIFPRFSQLSENRDLSLEISSPGMQRVIKDTLEFNVFLNKDVRIYCNSRSSYIIGKIKNSDDKSVTLSNYIIENSKENGDEITLLFSDINKAKLEVKWEKGND